MTPDEWRSCEDPMPMLEFLSGTKKASSRKLRLFAVAICRRVWPLLVEERSRAAVETAEAFADGAVPTGDRRMARTAALEVIQQRNAGYGPSFGSSALRSAASAAYHVLGKPASDAARICSQQVRQATAHYAVPERPAHPLDTWNAIATEEGKEHCRILRDLFEPFHVVQLNSAVRQWNDEAIPKMAQDIYQRGRWSDMHILANALADAGCADREMLAHCRSPEPHARGCWVVDLLLGKT